MPKKHIVFLAGGGTGGHVVPVFELYKKLKKLPDLRPIVIGSGSEIERKFFNDNVDYKVISAGKLYRRFTLNNIIQLFKFIAGLFQVLFLIAADKPKIIFIKGGYVSLPVAIWAGILRIPYIVHESDIETGLSNKISAKKAEKIFVGFPTENYDFEKDKLIFSGQIIKENFFSENSKNYILFDLDKDKKTILITGGSQGSANINKNTLKILPELLKKFNIIHQTGSLDYDKALKFKNSLDANLKRNYYVKDFLAIVSETDWMLEAVNLADIVVARAGANTLAEVASKGKAIILIPYQHAAGDHQLKNAKVLEENNAAIIILDKDLTADNLLQKINFLNKPENMKKYEDNSKKIFPVEGLNMVYNYIIEKTLGKEEK